MSPTVEKCFILTLLFIIFAKPCILIICSQPKSFHDMDQIIYKKKKKAYFQNFSWFQFYIYELCMIKMRIWLDSVKVALLAKS